MGTQAVGPNPNPAVNYQQVVAVDPTTGLPSPSGGASGAGVPVASSAAQITTTKTTLVAATNTTIAAANPNRIALWIQTDGAAAARVGLKGETLSGTRGGETQIPAVADALLTPPIASTTAVTAYSTGTPTLYVTEWLKA